MRGWFFVLFSHNSTYKNLNSDYVVFLCSDINFIKRKLPFYSDNVTKKQTLNKGRRQTTCVELRPTNRPTSPPPPPPVDRSKKISGIFIFCKFNLYSFWNSKSRIKTTNFFIVIIYMSAYMSKSRSEWKFTRINDCQKTVNNKEILLLLSTILHVELKFVSENYSEFTYLNKAIMLHRFKV